MFTGEEEEGTEWGAGRQFVVFSLKNITKISFVNEKVLLEQGEEKLAVVVDSSVSMGFVQDTLVTMWSLSKTKKTKVIQGKTETAG